MKGLHGIVFTYEKFNNLRDLTEHRVPASVPFAGRYRIIDFVLSSMVNAGMTDVGVIVHGKYQSLLDHLGSGKDWDLSRVHGGLKILPPFAYALQSGTLKDFRGKLDALNGVRTYLDNIRQSHVVLADGDIVVNLPLRDVYQKHLDTGADITAVCTSAVQDMEDATYFRLDKDGKVTETLTGVRTPENAYQSLELYILSKELLLKLVDGCVSRNLYSLRNNVLQDMGDKLNIQSYVWDGYAARMRSVQEYYDRSMALLDSSVRREVFQPRRPILTKERTDASTYVDPDGSCTNSLVADGCTIEGTVENCILFRGVHIARGAQVKNSILMQDVSIGKGAVLHHIIADKNVRIADERTLMGHQQYPMVIAKDSSI